MAVSSAPLWRWDGDGETSWWEVSTTVTITCVFENPKEPPNPPKLIHGISQDVWYPNGNCLVYLHSRRRPRAAPSFRLPLSALLAAGCQPLVERFGVVDGRPPRSAAEAGRWCRLNPGRTVELFVPPPPKTTRDDDDDDDNDDNDDDDNEKDISHLLAMRNLLAWVVGRGSLVGHCLGPSLVSLLVTMRQFRTLTASDCAADLVDYLADRGFLIMTNSPHRAAALLILAETARLAGLYREAFAHCVGMSERLAESPEYEAYGRGSQNVSTASKALIARARSAVDARLALTSAMLSNFLDDELDSAHVGMSVGIRSHLERFRSFLMAFYSGRFGYYPPRSFNATVYRAMGRDFTCLYHHLKDAAFTRVDMMPSAAAGGLCVLQVVQNMDGRNRYDPLRHPLPLLPSREGPSMRTSWLARLGGRRAADNRRLEHEALVRATNRRQDDSGNDLLRAYRRFEEDSTLSPPRHERVSLVDARKVRWILIYAVHQTLRHATRRPSGVRDDADARYLLVGEAVPPWKQPPGEAGKKVAAMRPETPRLRIDIKPDIDYLALTQQPSTPLPRSASFACATPSSVVTMERSKSFNRVLSRNSTIRRSVRRLRRAASSTTTTSDSVPPSPCKLLYHEIVVDGYGNGINHVGSVKWASRSCSTASQTSSAFTSTASPVTTSSAATSVLAPDNVPETVQQKRRRWSQPDAATSPRASIAKANSLSRRPVSALEGFYHESRSMLAGGIAMLQGGGNEPKPLPTHHSLPNVIAEEPRMISRDSGDWTAMQTFLDGAGGVLPAWEQYAELGGLTEMK
ncbi:hypothetical protein L249_6538 [Ophiocordyceps polyrhachis-furcata BCC 54312]|uniref:DUF8004 domain-containing protein n=1 Tax=Ophiocordyceps polyrhachis-furcata BCC 54312 TaxID=1330021 RepID=A0A367LK67_9HYPO|nr:hypothetical protein L249_6538 [Ophiocordyceps polyrhachis-furcata BCC 54312]